MQIGEMYRLVVKNNFVQGGCYIYLLCGGYIWKYVLECICVQKVKNLFRNWSDFMESLLVFGYF